MKIQVCSGSLGGPGRPGRQCSPGGQVRVVQVIKFVNVYDLHCLNNKIIEKT